MEKTRKNYANMWRHLLDLLFFISFQEKFFTDLSPFENVGFTLSVFDLFENVLF